MSENSLYMVVITGKALPGHEIANVKNNVGLRFNIQDARIDKMFSGKPVAIKRGLTLEAARNFKVAFAQLGAEAMVMADQKSPAPAAQAQAAPKPAQKKAKPKAPAKAKAPAKPQAAPKPSAPPVPPPPPVDPIKEKTRARSKEEFARLDKSYQAVASSSGFQKMNTLFAFLTILLIVGIGAAWALTPVTWYMAVPAMIVALMILGIPLMRSQTVFLKKVMDACVDEQAPDMAFSLACMDTWLDTLEDTRQASLIRKELDEVIGRHADLMEKMSDYAYVLAEIAQEELEKAEAEEEARRKAALEALEQDIEPAGESTPEPQEAPQENSSEEQK